MVNHNLCFFHSSANQNKCKGVLILGMRTDVIQISGIHVALPVSESQLKYAQPIGHQDAGNCCRIYIIIANILITV